MVNNGLFYVTVAYYVTPSIFRKDISFCDNMKGIHALKGGCETAMTCIQKYCPCDMILSDNMSTAHTVHSNPDLRR